MRWMRFLGGSLVRIAAPLVVAVGAAAYFHYQRHWVLTLALWTGLALGVLLYAAIERLKVLRRLYRK